MPTFTHKSVLTWAMEGHRYGKKALDTTPTTEFRTAGYNYLLSVISDQSQLLPFKVEIDGVEVSNDTTNLPKHLGPVVVTRLWESQQQAQDFVDFTIQLCNQHEIPPPSAVVEPN